MSGGGSGVAGAHPSPGAGTQAGKHISQPSQAAAARSSQGWGERGTRGAGHCPTARGVPRGWERHRSYGAGLGEAIAVPPPVPAVPGRCQGWWEGTATAGAVRAPSGLLAAATGRPGSSLTGTERVKMVGRSVVVLALGLLLPCARQQYLEEAKRIMTTTPVIDGHNDLPWQLLKKFNNQLGLPEANLTQLNSTHTNIPKLRSGHVGGQFWAAYVPCDTQNKDAVKRTLEQIDVVHRMCELYPETFACVVDSSGIQQAFQNNKVASLIGVEGGHSIDSSLGVLRTFYRLGVRYLTLTHSCNTPWADNWLVDTDNEVVQHHGLSPFGKTVVAEMNRLGMIVDLAHVSVETMEVVLNISKAPVIFSHSSAYTLCQHRRNVPDNVLRMVASTGSLVMVNFYSGYVTCGTPATLADVADHMDHVKKVASVQSVGFGGDYDGVTGLPTGLEDVSTYPALVAELLRRNWTEAEVKAALADNLLRVFTKVEEVKTSLQGTAAHETPIAFEELEGTCRTRYGYGNGAGTARLPLAAPVLALALLCSLLL
ncbi:dipeptidase 1 [Rhynochetos jubatus]